MPGEKGEIYSGWGFQEIHHGVRDLLAEPGRISGEDE